MQSDKTAIIVASLSAVTAIVTWVFRFRIAELGKRKNKTPSEVLYEGYETLLKQYQIALVDRDDKINRLEDSFNKVQTELNKSREVINQLKKEDIRKSNLISEMELKLSELKNVHAKPETS